MTCGGEVPAENKQIPSGRATVNLERAEAQSFVPDGPSFAFAEEHTYI